MKMLHINKGNCHFSTKGDLVYDYLTQHEASNVSITLSNARLDNDNIIIPFDDFNFEKNYSRPLCTYSSLLYQTPTTKTQI